MKIKVLLLGLCTLATYSCQNATDEPQLTEKKYEVRIVTPNGSRSTTGGTTTGAGLYLGTDKATVTATPDPGYVIDYFYSDDYTYSGSETATASHTFNINNKDHTFYVNFKKEETINKDHYIYVSYNWSYWSDYYYNLGYESDEKIYEGESISIPQLDFSSTLYNSYAFDISYSLDGKISASAGGSISVDESLLNRLGISWGETVSLFDENTSGTLHVQLNKEYTSGNDYAEFYLTSSLTPAVTEPDDYAWEAVTVTFKLSGHSDTYSLTIPAGSNKSETLKVNECSPSTSITSATRTPSAVYTDYNGETIDARVSLAY